MKKTARDRILKQKSVRKNQSDTKKKEDRGKQHVTRAELQGVQTVSTKRTDTAIMGVAALAEILVKNKLCTYEDVKVGERKMLNVLNNVRVALGEGYKELGLDAKPEELNAFVYEKCVAKKIDKDLLKDLFGFAPSKSRIITPRKDSGIIVRK